MFKVNEDPNDWGRCKEDGRIVHWTDQRSISKHIGHHVKGIDGFHINELIRYWLGWL